MHNGKKTIKVVGINARFTHSCLALFYVRNEVERHCPDLAVELLQFTINDNYYEMLLRLSREKPGCILFSAAIWNSSLIERLTVDLKACLPSCRVVIGGPQASVLAARLEGLMGSFCTTVIGEIEAVGPEFFRDLAAGCLGPRYRGAFFRLPGRTFGYPYREDDFSGPLKNRHIYYESSRGCPFQCSYCLSATEKGLYHKELATVQRELREILRHRPRVVRFIDRTFNDLPERALAIWRFLAMEGGDTLFHFELAPDRFTDGMFELLATLAPGRFQFELGVQSTHPPTLAAVNRAMDLGAARHNVARLAALGTIHLHVDLILGLPFETAESFAESFRDIFAMGAHYIQMGLLKILPDTPICHGAEEFGYVHCSEPPYAVLHNHWLDHPSLSRLYWFGEVVEKFYNNRYFVSLWRYLRQRQEDSFAFFADLAERCQAAGFFQLAPTQELMGSLLVDLAASRPDRRLIVELLRYDWLRCGFRFLPPGLECADGEERPEETRSALYRGLPAELDGVYRKNTRNQFFRKSFFLRISRETMEAVGLEGEGQACCLCVLPERENSLWSFNKVLIL